MRAGGEIQPFPALSMTRHDVRKEVMNWEGTEKETGEGRGRGQRLEYLPGEFSEGLHWFPRAMRVGVGPA